MKKIETWFVAFNRGLVAALLATVFIIVFINVVGRYGFGTSIPWAEEAVRHLMILCAFSASGLALREGRLVAITILPDLLPSRFRYIIRCGILIVMFLFMLLIFWLGIKFVQFGWNKETMSTNMSRGIPYLAIPIGCVFFLIQLLFFSRRFIHLDFELEDEFSETEKGE